MHPRSSTSESTPASTEAAPDQPELDVPAPPEPANRAARRAAKRAGGAADPAEAIDGYRGARHTGPAHPGARGRRVVPIRRTG